MTTIDVEGGGAFTCLFMTQPNRPTASPPFDAPEERLARNEAYWQAQIDSILRDRRQLRWVLPVGLFFAVLYYACRPVLLEALGVLAVGLSVWAMGLYMTGVRHEEFVYQHQEATRERDQARGGAS